MGYNLHNYNERLVWEQIDAHAELANADDGFIEDVACLTLNQVMPRYVRHDVDTAFYLSSSEQATLRKQLANALEAAIAHVRHNPR